MSTPFLFSRRFVFRATLAACGTALALPSAWAQQPPLAAAAQAADEAQTARALDVSVAVVRQMEAVMADKASRTPAQKKIAANLLFAAREAAGQPQVAGAPDLQLETGVTVLDAQKRVALEIRAASVTPTLLQAIRQAGGQIMAVSPNAPVVSVRLPLGTLETIAARAEVRNIRPIIAPITNRRVSLAAPRLGVPLARPLATRPPLLADAPPIGNAGSITSEGDAAHRANTARSTYSISGAGVKVGVLSDSVQYLSQSQASGELGAVTVLPGQEGTTKGEGTAMLEIVHDLAPNAGLYFATGFNGNQSFADNIRALYSTYGCNVIVDDVLYLDELPFQDDTIAQAVDFVTGNGVHFFSSAGNQGNLRDNNSSVWEGDFNDSGLSADPVLASATLHRYNNTGSGLYNTVTGVPLGNAVFLFWADPKGASANDYDLFSVKDNGSALRSLSNGTQDGTQDPIEGVDAFQGDRIYIARTTGAALRALHLNAYGNPNAGPALAYNTTGQTHGHNATRDAIGVAAVSAANKTTAFTNSETFEYFSSDGPRRIFFNPNGTPANAALPSAFTFASGGGVLLLKPELTAADGVVTSVPTFPRFYGTSAAAPHAAAISALVKSYSATIGPLVISGPKLSVGEMRTTLFSSALDINDLGTDINTGYGIVMPIPAVQFLQNFLPTTTITSSTFTANSAQISWTTNLPATSVVSYGTSPNALNATVSDATPVTSHRVTLTGLTPATTYYYRVSSSTPTGSLVFSGDPTTRSFATASASTTGSPQVQVSAVSLARVGSEIVAQITLKNNGAGTAINVRITSATLGSAATTTGLPLVVGTIAPGATTSATVRFAAQSAGASVLRVAGTDNSGATFSVSSRVTIP